MSVRCIDAVFSCPAVKNPTHLLIAIALADWSDDEGRSYPGVKKLAQKARLGKRTVQENLRSMPYVTVEEGAGPRGTNVYQLDLPWLRGGYAVKVSGGAAPAPLREPQGCGSPHGGGAAPAPNTSEEPSDSNNNNNRAGSNRKRKRRTAGGPPPPADGRAARYPYDAHLARKLLGRGVYAAVAAELVTECAPERIAKELHRLTAIEGVGPVKGAGALLVRFLRGPDRELPGWAERWAWETEHGEWRAYRAGAGDAGDGDGAR